MDIHHVLPAAAFALAVAGAAQADGPRPTEAQAAPRSAGARPMQAQPVAFGAVSGVAYHTVERDGARVVATLAQTDTRGEAGTPVRVEVVLAPCRPSPTSLRGIACGDGQSIVLSAPRAAGTAPDAVALVRQGDRVFVHEAAVSH